MIGTGWRGKKVAPGLLLPALVAWILALLALSAPAALAVPPTFTDANPRDNATGSGPFDVASGDFDEDGDLDLATADSNSNTVSVLFGDGVGGFAPAGTYPVGAGPSDIGAADVNADGFLDLIVPNRDSDNVSVLLNNGTGVFAQPAGSLFAVGDGPSDVTIADFDRDGNLDVAVTNFFDATNTFGTTVSVLLGNGDGTFRAPTAFTVGTEPFGITSADYDGDGNVDLATANNGSDTVSVLLGNGDGTFRPAVNYQAGDRPFRVVSRDFNGDGNTDLAVTNSGSDSVSVFEGNGDGTFEAAAGFGVGGFPLGLASADFDDDGRPDLAIANGDVNTVSVLLNATAYSLSVSDATVTEGNKGTTKATFIVTLDRPSSTPVTVDYATADGTAKASPKMGNSKGDYAPGSGTLTIAPGETDKKITIPVVGDKKREDDETFLVILSGPAQATIGDGEGTGTIVNDDVGKR